MTDAPSIVDPDLSGRAEGSLTVPRRPVLRYHGGKWMLAPWIISHFPAHRIYVEPFMGAASVLMRKARSHAETINDLDGDIVNVFRVLRDPKLAQVLAHQLELTPWARDEFVASYESSADPIERARRTLARSFMGFGTSSRRKGMTGFRAKCYDRNQTGVDDWTNYPAAIATFASRLRGVCVENAPATDIIGRNDGPNSLFYCDPPYPLETRSSMRGTGDMCRAYQHEMTDDDHRQLAQVLRSARGMVILSGYACDLYDLELYPDWRRVTRDHLTDGAQTRTEVLWLNSAAVNHHHSPDLGLTESGNNEHVSREAC